MTTLFLRGQQLGREDLNIYLTNTAGNPSNAAEISYALYDFTTGREVLVGRPVMVPENPSVGEYYASVVIPLDANIGDYRIRWTFKELVGGPTQEVLQEFTINDRDTKVPTLYTGQTQALITSLRTNLRDWNPDKHYKFRPPTHEGTVEQYSRVFGFIWEDLELAEYLERATDMVIAAPPRTPFMGLEGLMRDRPEWKTLVIQGAMYWALQALQINWISEEFTYSIGGVSLDLERSSKYSDAKQSAKDTFNEMLEKAKATVKVIRGLQQPKWNAGLRSSFGPATRDSVLTPAKFSGY